MEPPALQYKCTSTVPVGQAMFWQWVYASLLCGSALLACLQVIQSKYKYISDLALDYFECGCAPEAAGCPLLYIWCRGREGALICTGLQINSTYQLSPECCCLSLDSPSGCLVWKPRQSVFWPALLSFFVLSWCSLDEKPKMVSVQVYVAHTLFPQK